MLFALEGSDANLVNGVDGDLAEECNNVIIGVWRDFFTKNWKRIAVSQMCEWLKDLAKTEKCEPFGYPHVLAAVGDDIANLFEDELAKQIILSYVNSVDQYGRRQSRKREREDVNEPFVRKKRVIENVKEGEGEGEEDPEILALPIDIFEMQRT